MRSHEELIAEEITTWHDPLVHRAVFGTADPGAIARLVSAFCAAALNAAVAGALFVATSVGSVHGLVLSDGRSIVLKVRLADAGEIAAMQSVQSHLAAEGLPVPKPILAPRPLAQGIAWAEEVVDRGSHRDGHDPHVRRCLAQLLAAITASCRSLETKLPPPLLGAVPANSPFPKPHSPLFDLSSPAGAWIDEIARGVRPRLVAPAGDIVIGHADLRAEHVRFDGDRIVAVYDWDSLGRVAEPVLVGIVAHAFTTNWSIETPQQAPSIGEAHEFIADYEQARARQFTAAERSTCDAALLYATAYTARCELAIADDHTCVPGGYIALLRSML